MSPYILAASLILRRTSFILLPVFLTVVFISLLLTQFTELATRSEILSLSSFVTLLSFSALAFNWCRVSSSIVSESLLNLVYQAGVDLFLASLLALVATFFAWLQINPARIPSSFQTGLFLFHWGFLFLSLLLFLVSMLSLLHVASHSLAADQKSKR